MRNTAMVSPPFGGLEKYSFLGKRRPLRHSDTPEGKIAAFRLIVVGKTSDFRLVSGQFRNSNQTVYMGNKNAIGQSQWCLNFLKNRQIKFNRSLLKLVINGTMVSLKREVQFSCK